MLKVSLGAWFLQAFYLNALRMQIDINVIDMFIIKEVNYFYCKTSDPYLKPIL